MKSPYKVLFVCLGNICRSPAADNIFRHLAEQAGLSDKITCDSAGTISMHTGKKPDSRMSRTLRQRDYPVTGAARGFQPSDFDDFNLILAMDRSNHRDILALAGNSDEKNKVRRFTDFCSRHDHSEVPDPYYGGSEGFELVADLIEDGAQGLLDHIQKEPGF